MTLERRLTKFLILFDNSNLLYFPGQFLSGRVIVELHDEMAITGGLKFQIRTGFSFSSAKGLKINKVWCRLSQIFFGVGEGGYFIWSC